MITKLHSDEAELENNGGVFVISLNGHFHAWLCICIGSEFTQPADKHRNFNN